MPKKPQYALTESKSAFLNTEFGRTYAMKVFGLKDHELEAIVGRYTQGKWKGELRGKITWTKCVEGGWFKREGQSRLLHPGVYDHKIVDPWARDTQGGEKVIWIGGRHV